MANIEVLRRDAEKIKGCHNFANAFGYLLGSVRECVQGEEGQIILEMLETVWSKHEEGFKALFRGEVTTNDK